MEGALYQFSKKLFSKNDVRLFTPLTCERLYNESKEGVRKFQDIFIFTALINCGELRDLDKYWLIYPTKKPGIRQL